MTEEEQETADQDGVTEEDDTEARLSKSSVGGYFQKVLAISLLFIVTSIAIGVVFVMFEGSSFQPVSSIKQLIVVVFGLIMRGLLPLVPATLVGLIAMAIRRKSGVVVAVAVSLCVGYLCGLVITPEGGSSMILIGIGGSTLIAGLTWFFWKVCGRIWRMF